MQSFYASCEIASRAEYASKRTQFDDATDPLLVVAGDPARRSGIVLAASPTAKKLGVTNAMRLGEALHYAPNMTVVRPRMHFYLQTSARIQQTMRLMFPLQEQFSIDEAFIAFQSPTDLFPDPIDAARQLRDTIWDLYRIRARIGLSYNKWMTKMANAKSKKSPEGIEWWKEEEIAAKLHPLAVTEMWGLKKRALTIQTEFGCHTIGDVARLPVGELKARFGIWGEVIHRWANGQDYSPINPDAYSAPHKGISHRTTLPRDFESRDEISVVVLELLDEVCRRTRRERQMGRRIGLGLTYARFEGGFFKARTLSTVTDDPVDLYPELMTLLDKWWHGERVRAVTVMLDELQMKDSTQLSLLDDIPKRQSLYSVVDDIRDRYGETAIMRGASLTEAGQILDRSQKIGGHYA